MQRRGVNFPVAGADGQMQVRGEEILESILGGRLNQVRVHQRDDAAED